MENVNNQPQPGFPSQAQSTSSIPTPNQVSQQNYVQPAYTQPEKPKSKWKKILAIFAVLILLGVALFGYLIFQGIKDAPQVQQKVTSFLSDVSNNDLETAYNLTSAQFKESTSKEDFTKARTLFKAQYAGFKEQKQTGFSVEANAGQPTLYKYSGAITYTDGDQGELSATLVKENGEYKILGIKVNVDIKRMEKFQQGSSDSVLGVGTEK
ncbi:MAG: hypothetical protein A2857_05590 [Candidatus Levybacteria bacterium RIFCSPHIGHO2_01_FULL_36_15]|nr:MAG: hypothetical protein A2857_05590 [Candidatus Levybacteria bacterium RIFCSPHIGHO2_01_FULL_36_15]OGH38990.1 MAG: hypothetical protein A2905_04740 [Candidatus Levybacteria bacterium RIFCSPLOWO2_01_FULL_36_10]